MCEKNYPPTPHRCKCNTCSITTPVHKNTRAMYIQNARINMHTQAKEKGLHQQPLFRAVTCLTCLLCASRQAQAELVRTTSGMFRSPPLHRLSFRMVTLYAHPPRKAMHGLHKLYAVILCSSSGKASCKCVHSLSKTPPSLRLRLTNKTNIYGNALYCAIRYFSTSSALLHPVIVMPLYVAVMLAPALPAVISYHSRKIALATACRSSPVIAGGKIPLPFTLHRPSTPRVYHRQRLPRPCLPLSPACLSRQSRRMGYAGSHRHRR